MAGGETGSAADDGGRADPVRVFVSYAHDDAEHEDRVRDFWLFLRAHGIDARLDKPAAERRQDWPLWMLREVRDATFVLVVASPAYRQRAEGEDPAGVGRGVQWEAALIREEVYADREAALNRFLPVVLPGCTDRDIPTWLGRHPLRRRGLHGAGRRDAAAAVTGQAVRNRTARGHTTGATAPQRRWLPPAAGVAY